MDLRGFREGAQFSGRGIWCTGRFGKFPKYWITTQSQGAAWFAENARKGKANRIWIEWKFDLEKTTNSGANLWQRKALHSNLPVPYWATTDSQSHLQLDVFFKLHLMEHPSHCTVTLLLPDCWKSPSYLIHKNFRLIEDICWKRNLVWKSVETFHHCWFYQLGFQHQDLQQHQMIKLLFIEFEEIEYL